MDTCNCSGGGGRNVQIGHGGGDLAMEIIHGDDLTSLSLSIPNACMLASGELNFGRPWFHDATYNVHTPSRDWKLLGPLSQSCPPT